MTEVAVNKGIEGKRYVSYYRVSTAKQGKSRLGLEAQKASVAHYNIVKEYVEVKSGRKKDRKVLIKALDYCLKNNCTLLVARLDRLARNASHAMKIRDSCVDLVIGNMPGLGIVGFATLAAVAEQEAETMSRNIRQALEARKQRGESNDRTANLKPDSRSKGGIQAAKNRAKTNKEKTLNIFKAISMLKRQKLGNTKIAKELNLVGYKTVTGKKFTKFTVAGLIKLHTKKGI